MVESTHSLFILLLGTSLAFANVKLKKPDSVNLNDIQLDLIVQLPESFYIFETKMGTVLAIDKWVDRTKLFASEKIVLLHVAQTKKLNPKIFRPFILFNLEQLQEQLSDLLHKDYSE